MLAGGAGAALCEDKPADDPDYNFLNIKMPAILRQKQAEKDREYQKLKEEALDDLDKLDDSTFREQIRQYTKGVTSEEQAEGFVSMVEDAKMLAQQNIRQVYLGPHESLLKPGRLIQLSIAKFNSPNEYDPLDRVIVLRSGDNYHALSSFCGYDMTDLANGVALGEKFICPTCGSEYRIHDGQVNFGPSFQSLMHFEIVNRKGHLFLLIPKTGVPPFSRKDIQDLKKFEKLDSRTIAIIGANESMFGVVQALRKVYYGKIVLVPLKKSGILQNRNTLSTKMEPLEKEDVMIVDEKFFQRMNVTVKTEPRLLGVDLMDKYLHFEGDQFIDFDKIIYTVECEDRKIPKDIKHPRIIPLNSYENHARIHNQAVEANDIVIYGANMESFQLASSLRRYLDSLGKQNVKITILDDKISELMKDFGPQMYNVFINLLAGQKIHVMTGITIKGIVDREGKLKVHFKYRPYSPIKNQLYDHFNTDVVSCYVNADLIIQKTEPGEPVINFHVFSHDKNGEIDSELDHSLRVNPSYQVSRQLDINHFIYGVGPSVSQPSMFKSDRMYRASNVAFNIQQGYVAGLNLVDKKYQLDFPPFQHFEIADQHFFFIGQKGQHFNSLIKDKTMEAKNKFVAYYTDNGRVVGALIMGYKNLHVYLSQAIQIGAFPDQKEMTNMTISSKEIVKQVIQNQNKIRCINEKMIQNRVSHRFYEKDDEIQNYKEERLRDHSMLEEEKKRRTEILNQQKMQAQKNKKRQDGQVELIQDEQQLERERLQKSKDSIMGSYLRGLLGRSKKS